MKKLVLVVLLLTQILLIQSCDSQKNSSDPDEMIKAYCLDFNWGEGGPNAFAEPGLWADADPQEHIKWYSDLGVNTIQTFIVSCNGYAWYKNGVVPAQPGLKHDFLPEMVRLGHEEGMKVMGYLCIGSNVRWGMENPDYSYGVPADRHIPFTLKYLDYLDELIRDAVKKTGIDGFMIDWFYQPNRGTNGGEWLDSEKQRYKELMNESFPEEGQPSKENYDVYSRLAIEACWNVIYKAAKETNPDCLLWLTCFDITHPHIVNSKMFQEIDWLMNEEGDLSKIDSIKSMVGKGTELITCLASWNGKDAKSVVVDATKTGLGLYGFAKPNKNSLLPPIEYFLSSSIDSFQNDERTIATFARVYNKHSLDFIQEKKLKFIFITCVVQEDFFIPVIKGMEDAAEMMDVECIFTGTEGVDILAQAEMVRQAIRDKYDGIVLNIIDPEGFDDVIGEAAEAGIPLLAFNIDDHESPNKRLSSVNQRLYDAGKKLGREAAEFIPDGSEILMTMHDKGVSALDDRLRGAQDGLIEAGRKHVKWRVAITGNTVSESTESITSILKAQPQIKYVLCTGQADTEGAGNAIGLNFAGQGYQAAGFDLSPAILQNIIEGHLAFTIDQQPYIQGFYPVMQLTLLLRYGIVPSDMDTGAALITKDNAKSVLELSKLHYR